MAGTHAISKGERDRLKIELEKEEVLLKNIKEKLLDQLHRLKVEELALEKYISLSNNGHSHQPTSTGSYFANQVNSNINETNQNDRINSVPLIGLNDDLSSHSLILNPTCNQYEEEDD